MHSHAPRIVFFDLETGGLDPRRHPILQIGAVAVGAWLERIESFEVKVRFNRKTANRKSLRKNHYQPGIWAREAVEPRDAARMFAKFLRRHATTPMLAADGAPYYVAQLAAHNATFDGSFLQAWYAKLNLYLPAERHVLCTMQRAMWLFRERADLPRPRNFKLATLCEYFGVPLHAAAAHEALADVEATASLYRRMQRQTAAAELAQAG